MLCQSGSQAGSKGSIVTGNGECTPCQSTNNDISMHAQKTAHQHALADPIAVAPVLSWTGAALSYRHCESCSHEHHLDCSSRAPCYVLPEPAAGSLSAAMPASFSAGLGPIVRPVLLATADAIFNTPHTPTPATPTAPTAAQVCSQAAQSTQWVLSHSGWNLHLALHPPPRPINRMPEKGDMLAAC